MLFSVQTTKAWSINLTILLPEVAEVKIRKKIQNCKKQVAPSENSAEVVLFEW